MGAHRPTPTDGILKRSPQVIVFVLILMAILFISEGRLDWVMARVFIGTCVGSDLVAVPSLEKADTGLMEERRQTKEGTRMAILRERI